MRTKWFAWMWTAALKMKSDPRKFMQIAGDKIDSELKEIKPDRSYAAEMHLRIIEEGEHWTKIVTQQARINENQIAALPKFSLYQTCDKCTSLIELLPVWVEPKTFELHRHYATADTPGHMIYTCGFCGYRFSTQTADS